MTDGRPMFRFHVGEDGRFAWCVLPGGWYEVRLRRLRRTWQWTLAERQSDGRWVTIAAGADATRAAAAQAGLAACGAGGLVTFDAAGEPDGPVY